MFELKCCHYHCEGMVNNTNPQFLPQLNRFNCSHHRTISGEALCIISRHQISMCCMSKTNPIYLHKNDSDFHLDLSIYRQDIRMVMAIIIVVLFVAILYLLSLCAHWCHCQCTACTSPQRNDNYEPPFELRVINRGKPYSSCTQSINSNKTFEPF